MADHYECTLDGKSIEKATNELKEDPKERLGQVETLRQWVLQQPHLNCKTDTPFLLRFLRTGKFSQLVTREKLERYVKSMQKVPEWLVDIDTQDPKHQAAYDIGYFLPLGKDFLGRTVVWIRQASMDVNSKEYGLNDLYKTVMSIFHYVMREEAVQVNGLVCVMDLTGYEMKHFTYWGIEDTKKSISLLQGAYPARFKGFYHYNTGPVFESVLAAVKPFMKKKIRDRIEVFDNMEGLYKLIPMEIIPDEYLPDDYNGPRCGTTQQLAAKLKAKMTEPEIRTYILKQTDSAAFHYAESKKLGEPAGSFRKLNIE